MGRTGRGHADATAPGARQTTGENSLDTEHAGQVVDATGVVLDVSKHRGQCRDLAEVIRCGVGKFLAESDERHRYPV